MFDVLTELYQGSSFIVPHDLSDFVSGVHSFQPPLIVVYCRVDRINEAEFKSASNTKTSPTHPPHHPGQQTSFLWTIGPRPFWELWPNKKHKKKKLNLEEFIQCLAVESYHHTAHSKKKTIMKEHVLTAIESNDELAFLDGAMDD